jgi:A118 family predicted phage portal protein
MFSPKTIESALHITPAVSNKMRTAIELWECMYKDESPWLSDPKIKSLGLPAMIASEKARTATIEMQVKITGESERAKFIKKSFKKVLKNLRKELEFGIALGGFIIKPYVKLGADGKYDVDFTFVKATNFYPLSFSSDGDITECVFIDRIIKQDKVYTKLEYHKLEGNALIVTSTAYVSHSTPMTNMYGTGELGEPIPLTSVPEWSNIEPVVTINNAGSMLFGYFKMPQANNVDLDSPLGVSGFSRAVSLIQEADEQYSNLLWEYEGGQLAIDVDRTALNPTKDGKGKEIEVLPQLQDRLYRRTLDLGADNAYNVFNPDLRDASILNGLNTILMHIEDVTELSRGTLSEVTYAEARTATEIKILKQRSFSANQDIQKELQDTLEEAIEAVDKYCDLYKINAKEDFEVAYVWDDSILVDKDTEREVDMLDVDKGLMSRVEYRMKWYGETEAQAIQTLKEIDEAALEKMTNQQTVMNNNTENGQATSDAEASYNKLKRANESTETTKNGSNP